MAEQTDESFKDPLGVNKTTSTPPDDGPTSSDGSKEESIDGFDLDVS